MTKNDIINEIVKKTGLSKDIVTEIIESLMKSIKSSLARGDNVILSNFGTFQVKKRAKKTARNILKNTTIIIPAHNYPLFKPSKRFKLKVIDFKWTDDTGSRRRINLLDKK